MINHDLEKTPLANHGIYEIGLLANYLQEYTRMETQFQYILEIGQKSNDSYLSLEALQYLAIAAKYQDQTLRAVNLSLQALKEIPVGDDDHIRSNLIVPSLIAMAGIAASFQPVRVAGLFGAVEALQENLTQPVYYIIFQMEFDRDVAALRSQIDAEVFRSAWAEGRAFTLEQAYQEALTLGEELAKGL